MTGFVKERELRSVDVRYALAGASFLHWRS